MSAVPIGVLVAEHLLQPCVGQCDCAVVVGQRHRIGARVVGRRHHPGRATLALYGISCGGMTVSTCSAAERKVGVFEAGDIREWRGHDVVDADGHKIGELEAIYVDTSTDLPAFATVTVGMPTRHRLVFVPLAQATVGPGYLKVAHDRKQVKDSPSISTDGELPAADEEAIFKHYGLTYQAGTSGERQLARR